MEVVLRTELVAAALKANEEYCYRDWLFLVHAGQGSGRCRLADFRAFLKNLGYQRQTIADSIAWLLHSGMAKQVRTCSGAQVLVPLTTMEMMDRYGLTRLKWQVRINLADLKGKGLRNLLFVHVEAGLGGNPVARATWEALTGVTPPTQRRGEARMGAQVTPNFERVDVSKVDEAADKMSVTAKGHEGRRAVRHGNNLYQQIPNSVSYPKIARKRRDKRRASTDNCRRIPERQQKHGKRYERDLKRAMSTPQVDYRVEHGTVKRPVLAYEGPARIRGDWVEIWGAD